MTRYAVRLELRFKNSSLSLEEQSDFAHALVARGLRMNIFGSQVGLLDAETGEFHPMEYSDGRQLVVGGGTLVN